MGDASSTFWSAARLIGALTFLSYVYSFGYLFRIEPTFIPAFSPVDLILWASTSLTGLVTIAFVASAGAFPFMAISQLAVMKGQLSAYQRMKELRKAQALLHGAMVVIPMAGLVTVLAATETASEHKPLLHHAPLLLLPFLAALTFTFVLKKSVLRISLQFWRRLFTLLVILIVFMSGDYQAVRRIYWEQHAVQACVGKPAPRCDSLVFLGSSALVVRRPPGFVLIPRDKDQWLTSPGAPGYVRPIGDRR